MKRLFLIAAILIFSLELVNAGKKYKFTYNSESIQIETVRVGKHGCKFIKSWAVDKNADKAIIKAKQNAVAAALFIGFPANKAMGDAGTGPICKNGPTYEENKEYFDKLFVDGEFLNYVVDVNSTYPTGQDNVQTPNGRRVGVYLQVLHNELKQRLIQDNIINEGMGKQLVF